MSELIEFFIPLQVRELEDEEHRGKGQYHVESVCDFDVPERQQLDELTRLFDSLHHEKSPTALFTKPESFYMLYSYVKAANSNDTGCTVIRAARHKICHEVGERMKKLLQVCLAFLRRRESDSSQGLLEVCLRSTLKMYVFILCNILLSSVPAVDDEDGTYSVSQRSNRKRKRRESGIGFGDDGSGVDMDGRELALTFLLDVCSPEIMALWPDGCLEDTTLRLLLRMSLHMITQKANITGDAQSVSGALAVLLARVCTCTLTRTGGSTVAPSDLVTPLVEITLQSECAALFLSKFVSYIEQERSSSPIGEDIQRALFESVAHSAFHEASADGAAGKNLALFLSEVAKKSVSVTVSMSELIISMIQCESYDIRKAVVTCIGEMITQWYTGHTRSVSGDTVRNSYLNELLFRSMDVNPFVRNHTLHVLEQLVEARAIPRRYHLACTEAFVGRLEDRNYLVRDSAMAVMSSVLKKNWFGHVLNPILVQEKLQECQEETLSKFPTREAMELCLELLRRQLRPVDEVLEGPTDAMTVKLELPEDVTDDQSASLNKLLYFEHALSFIHLCKESLRYACALLDSKTERDVMESIKLIVVCCEYRLEGSDTALLRVLVMVFQGELKIQLAVRDAFAEVVFASFHRISNSAMARTMASAQKLITILRDATEGEVSAVDRVLGLLKAYPTYARYLSGPFIDAIWGIAEGSLDSEATLQDRRTAMRLYSMLSKCNWKDLRTRADAIIEFLGSDADKDNTLIAYAFTSLQNEGLDPQVMPIPPTCNPMEHRLLKHVVTHLCRRTMAISSWMNLAEAAVNVIHHLCEVPVALYTYVLEYLSHRAQTRDDPHTKAQLYFLVGRTALKQLIAVESAERQQLKALDEPTTSHATAEKGTADSMYKELGLGSHEFRRHAIHELTQRRRQAIIAEGSIWHRYTHDIVAACKLKPKHFDGRPFERVCLVMALTQLMIVSEAFCGETVDLLFSLLADQGESWVVKTNAVLALGDLACVHPNVLGPYLKVPTTGFFKLLADDDLRVRAVTIQVCSHLVLGEMLRIRDHLYTIVKLVADPDESIASNAMTFVQNLAMKEKEKTGNLIPPLVGQLSGCMPADKFQTAMRPLLERVDGDKQTDSLIDRLCQRFAVYAERSKKKVQLARNVAFCLSELSYSTERATKRIMSDGCYQQYKHWLRDEEVHDYFKSIVQKAKRSGSRAVSERRDKSTIEEWEARMSLDTCVEAKEASGAAVVGEEAGAAA